MIYMPDEFSQDQILEIARFIQNQNPGFVLRVIHRALEDTDDASDQIWRHLNDVYGKEQMRLIARFICTTNPDTVLNTIRIALGESLP